MLTISQLSAWFPVPHSAQTGTVESQVLHEVSLSISKAETVAIVGESGSGKSVTALTILRLLEESTGIRTSGSIMFNNEDLLKLPLNHIRSIRGNRIAMIFQEPMTSLNPVYTIGSQIIEPLKIHQGMTRSQARVEAIRLLEKTGIVDPSARMDVYPHQLSGGQRQRVMIAMALACKPSLLIADEPTTALDVSIQSQILELINDIKAEYDMAMLLITHDLSMVQKISDTIYIMKEGKIIESGLTRNIFNYPVKDYTKRLLSSIPQGAPEEKRDTSPLISTCGLSCHFKLNSGWKHPFKRNVKLIRAVDDISLLVKRGTTCGIIGESGSGKTTLGLALLKLIKSNGSIMYQDENIQYLPAKRLRSLRKKMQIVFQDPFSSLSPRMSIGEIVEEGLKVHRRELTKIQRETMVHEALEEVGLKPDIISRYPHEFSGGQRQRIAIARVIILRPEFLILDEPTSSLDMTIQAQMLVLLKTLQEKHDLTYLFISHDLRVIRAISDYIVVMQHGKVVESGTAKSIFENPQKRYTIELFQAALGKAAYH